MNKKERRWQQCDFPQAACCSIQTRYTFCNTSFIRISPLTPSTTILFLCVSPSPRMDQDSRKQNHVYKIIVKFMFLVGTSLLVSTNLFWPLFSWVFCLKSLGLFFFKFYCWLTFLCYICLGYKCLLVLIKVKIINKIKPTCIEPKHWLMLCVLCSKVH